MLTIGRLSDVVKKTGISQKEKTANVFLLLRDLPVSFVDGRLRCADNGISNYRYSKWLITINAQSSGGSKLEEFVFADLQQQAVIEIIVGSFNGIGSKQIKRVMVERYLYNYPISKILTDCAVSLYSYYQFLKIGEMIFLKNIEKELCYNTNYEET
ncbi:MAG: hypothetical protein ACI4WG_04850 [Erysipelotrichaceae bacterium]